MKKLFLSLATMATIATLQHVNASTITVYGRNQGTTSVTVRSTDGTVTTTTTIDCDNFFNEVCYTISDVPMQPTPRMGNVGDYVHIIAESPKGTKVINGYLKSMEKSKAANNHTVSQIVTAQ